MKDNFREVGGKKYEEIRNRKRPSCSSLRNVSACIAAPKAGRWQQQTGLCVTSLERQCLCHSAPRHLSFSVTLLVHS
jgi:hypothetical protein